MKYTKKFQEVLNKLNSINDEECQYLKEEIKILADIYTKKDTRLDKIIKLSDKQQKAILKLNEELDDYKSNLEQKVKDEIQKRQKQEEVLIEQTRLAALSEMINAVAHQWMQPLNILWLNTEVLEIEAKRNNGLSPQRVKTFKDSSLEQINHLTDTLKNFRNFFQPVHGINTFKVIDVIESVITLINDELEKYAIDIEFDKDEDFILEGNENEFKHIFINLINNSKYAFLENSISNRKITIKLNKEDKKIEYFDNAGGIDQEILPEIFNMHVSTKQNNGTGVGLYLSRQIAHKHNGELKAENHNDGAKFTFFYKG